MTFKDAHIVHVEKRSASLAEMMNRVRSWLDDHKIEPAELLRYIVKYMGLSC
jgi:hypothetical protein